MHNDNALIKLIAEGVILEPLPDLSFKGGYRKVYRLARDFIRQWKGNEKASPSLGGNKVLVSNKVFKHLVGKSKGTNYTDSLARLRHIPNAKQILETVEAIFDRVIKSPRITIYAFLGQINGGRFIKVIVESDKRSGINKLISLYEVTGSFYSILTNCVDQTESDLLQEIFKKPVVKLKIKKGQKISGWLVMSGKISESHQRIILYTDGRLLLLDLSQTEFEKLKPGCRISIQ